MREIKLKDVPCTALVHATTHSFNARHSSSTRGCRSARASQAQPFKGSDLERPILMDGTQAYAAFEGDNCGWLDILHHNLVQLHVLNRQS